MAIFKARVSHLFQDPLFWVYPFVSFPGGVRTFACFCLMVNVSKYIDPMGLVRLVALKPSSNLPLFAMVARGEVAKP